MTTRLRVAAIGDSLTQGFMSGAISRTDTSFPALIADALHLEIPRDFSVPSFPGSGLPLNLEECLHYIGAQLGPEPSGARTWLWRFPQHFRDFADRVEDLYERGAGNNRASFGGTYHNLAVWGFRVHDSYTVTPQVCQEAIDDDEGWIEDDFLGLPSAAMYRTAWRVLNPRRLAARDGLTQISALSDLIDRHDGLDVLFLFLGANDCLGTVLSLEVNDMSEHQGKITNNPVGRRKWNLTSAEQFEKDYQRLVQELDAVLPSKTKVFVATVPHVTIPPVTRGIGKYDGKYFEYYARFFMTEGAFNPWLNAHISREQAELIDERIDEFNRTIKKAAKKNSWHVVDVSKSLDTLAVRRNGFEADPGRALRDYFARQGIADHPLLNLDPVPSILTLKTADGGQRLGGGLFSLDCVHPTTIGYGLIAEMFLRKMKDANVSGADPQRLNWRRIIQQDRLLHSAPAIWDDVVDAAQNNTLIWDVLFSIMG